METTIDTSSQTLPFQFHGKTGEHFRFGSLMFYSASSPWASTRPGTLMETNPDLHGHIEVGARYYDGRTSGFSAVRLSFGRSGRITLRGEGRQANYGLDELVISSRIGDTPRLIGLPNGHAKLERGPDNCRHQWRRCLQFVPAGSFTHRADSHQLLTGV